MIHIMPWMALFIFIEQPLNALYAVFNDARSKNALNRVIKLGQNAIKLAIKLA